MKVQCSCGAKFAFDVSPEMLQRPIQFVCPQCGADSSEQVNKLIRQELSFSSASAAASSSSSSFSHSPAPPVPVSEPQPGVRLRVAHHEAKAQGPAPTETAVSDEPQFCLKHPGQMMTTKCYVCSKPMCPECMELFGYVCSPLCKARADSHGIDIPVYEGQRSYKDAQWARRVTRITATVCIVGALIVGVWFWYAWFGSSPRVAYSVRFPQRAFSGQTALVGKDQLIILHGDTLIRQDLKKKDQVWSQNVIDKKAIDDAVAQTMQFAKAAIDRANNEDPDNVPKMPSADRIAREMERTLEEECQLRLEGTNIWVIHPNKLIRYDWDTGKQVNEIPLPADSEKLVSRGDELMMLTTHYSGEQTVTRVNLTTCDSRTDSMAGQAKPAQAETVATNLPFGLSSAARFPLAPPPSKGSNAAVTKAASRLISGPAKAGLPTGMPGKDAGKPLDPAKVAAQAQHMSLPARIALPATLSANLNQERALAEASDSQKRAAKESLVEPDNVTVIPDTNGFTQFSVRLIEERLVSHSAMKAGPKTSVLNGTLTAGNTMEAANEILNEMQRMRGGDTVEEDESRYLVKLKKAGGKDDWSGEVIGPPRIFPLQTVNVVAANKMIMVFDKANNPMWKSPLNYNIGEGFGLFERDGSFGQGPCVEHKGSLYVFDQGVLTAFDLPTGNVRWRLPSVGVAGLFFDDEGMMYVNTTTGDPESIRYARQIDLTQKAVTVVLKIEPRTGKTLWTAQPGGLVNYVSGQYVYVVQSYQPPEEDEDDPYHPDTGFEARPYLRIRRLNPKNGHEMWEHYQSRAPLDVQFDKNTIRLLFKSEAQVLTFLSLK